VGVRPEGSHGTPNGMRFLLVSALALALACGGDDRSPDSGSPAADAASTPTPLRVMTWNVENLFDEMDDPETMDDVPTAGAVQRKLDDIAEVVRAVNPDFLALQEVENIGILDRLADELDGLGYVHTGLVDSTDPRGIDVAFISRVPLAEYPTTTSHIGERFPEADGTGTVDFTRDALEVFLDVEGKTVGIVIVHFLSRRNNDADKELVRQSEALQTMRIAQARMDGGMDRVLVMGDMNDRPDSPTVTNVLSGSLTNVTQRVANDDRWTYVFDGVRQQLDYIMASPAMNTMARDVVILHTDAVDAASDHKPVAADFVVE